MKKIIRLLLILTFVTIMLTLNANANQEETEFKARTYIDNPAEIYVPEVKQTMQVTGWYMSNDTQAQIKVYVDEEEVAIKKSERENRQDVLDSIKGYGGIEENPQPGYSLEIDISNVTSGIHTLKVQILSRTNQILATDTRKINVLTYKAKTYIDFPTEINTPKVKDILELSGWYMSEDIEAQLKVYIDNQEQSINSLEREKRQDVINAIKGYGTEAQNPQPGYTAQIDISKIKNGIHTVKTVIVSRNNEILATDTRTINVQNYKAKMYVENPKEWIETSISGDILTIGGWVMTDDINSKIKVYIDGKQQTIKEEIKEKRQDVIDAIKGYGTEEQNPTPGYLLKIDISNIKDGKHTIRVDIESIAGEVLASNTRNIDLKKYVAKIYIEKPLMWGTEKPVLNLGGWIMATDTEYTIDVYIDGKVKNFKNLIREERTDVINAIKGYGTQEQNPTPGFSMTVDAFDLSEGTHTIVVEVKAKSGETIASDFKYVTIEKYKARTYIDNPAEFSIKKVEGLLIVNGWVMSDDTNYQMKAYINGKEQEILDIERTERIDVLESVKGYGTKEQNLKPGYEFTLDLTNINDGIYELRVDVISITGEVIATNKRTIENDKYIAKGTLEIPKQLGQFKQKLTVSGWVMTTDTQATINVYINNKKQEILNLNRIEREDVIKVINGYGGIELNPTPGYEAEIDISKFEDGKYEFKIEVVSRENEIMYSESKIVVIYNKYDVGIDVSKHNGNIDWKQVKNSGIDFAIIRAGFRGYGTEGTLNEDTLFVQNMQGAISNGIEVGVYFYSQAINEEEAVQEAEMTIRMIKDNGFANDITFPVIIDCEASSGRGDKISVEQRTQNIIAFCEKIKQEGYKPMLYSNKNWLEEYIDTSKLSEYDIWLAHYTGTTDPVNNPSSYKGTYHIWQYTSSGSVPGISTNVDINIAYKKYFKN